MTETTNPAPSDPAGPTAPTGGLNEGRSTSGESAALAPVDTADPSKNSGGRGEGAF